MNYTLKDLLDIPKLQTLLDTLDEIYSMPSAIIDIEGNILTATAWQDICLKFHRANPETEKKCKESDSYITKKLNKNPPHVIYNCPFGLVDTATPIIVEGHHLGNVFTGQFFTVPPDEEKFIHQARQYGFDGRNYLEALRKVPILSEERLHMNLKFLNRFTEMLVTQGLLSKRQLETEEMLRKGQAMLEDHNRFIESLINLSPDIIYIYDLIQQENVYSNNGIQTMLGYSVEDIKNMGNQVLPILMHPDDLIVYMEETIPKYAKAKDNDMILHEFRMKDKNGNYHSLECTELIYKRQSNGLPHQIFGVVHDITERERLEEEREKLHLQLMQSQKMEAIGHLAGGVAHDFNNILSAIVGYAHIMLIKMKSDDPLRRNLEQILASSEKAESLTKSLLAFSRKQPIQMNSVNINDIILGVTKILDRIIGEDINLQVNTAVHDLIVNADANQLEQVLMNLATNARDALHGGGKFTVTTEALKIDEKYIQMHREGKVGKYAVISVTDTGTGMSKKTKEKIFEPFFTTKVVGKGTGLGLSMIYGTIKQHNGFITVYSELGKGTTFKIYLPLAKSRGGFTENKGAIAIPSGTETILLVEDDEAVRSATKGLLKEFGYSVIDAIDGKQAVKIYKENKDIIRVVVTDIIMPGQNGKDLHDELMKITTDIKVLFISGYPENFLTKKGVIDTKMQVLLKPVKPDILCRKIRELLDD